MKGRFSSNFYINNSFTPLESTRLKSLFDSSVLIRSSHLPALRRRTSRSPLRNLILSRRRAQVSVQLTSDQLQRLAKIPICSGKSVEFSHLSGNLAWVEETLTAMGWTKLCQISELFVASAVRSFYASLKASTDVPMSTKEKFGLITLRRSHYSLVGKKQNLWYKDSIPECEHEVYPDEPLSKLPNQLSLLKYHLKMLSFLPPPLFLSKMLPLRLYMKS
ncbi:hypothetical protein Taro_017586 [Colocasia esculenta]|uniref:Uncharacterized protein n=1 Tax=Colocasia esculenta TaxID=4460 RepID=A0A843UTP1_COLES|nr:hypothetical protein [Colocasia esculenta]